MDYLKSLPRKQLQALAKVKGVRANQKSEDIIAELIINFPASAVSPGDADNSASVSTKENIPVVVPDLTEVVKEQPAELPVRTPTTPRRR